MLVLPYWPSAAYWPLIATSKANFLPFVIDYRIFDNPSQCFSLGNNKKSLIGLSIYQLYKNTLKTHFGHTACQVNAKLESEPGLINY